MAGKKRLIVVALGGNAISRPEEEGNVDQQFANARLTARALADLIAAGDQLVITHGNGPQIGNFLLRNEAAIGTIYALPMEVAVAHVQGGMGFMIAQTLTNELNDRGMDRQVSVVVTTVLVDRSDPAFRTPTKPIGRIMTKEESEHLAQLEGWHIKEIEPGKFRRVIPSPMPQRIMEMETLRHIIAVGEDFVACGGGGIAVVHDPQVGLRGVRAVIDKDLASALLASEIDANGIVCLTNVDHVLIDYKKPSERAVERMTMDEARRWHDEGQFPVGSMGPKVKAAIQFLARSQRDDAFVIIGPLHKAADAVAGRVGTRITKR